MKTQFLKGTLVAFSFCLLAATFASAGVVDPSSSITSGMSKLGGTVMSIVDIVVGMLTLGGVVKLVMQYNSGEESAGKNTGMLVIGIIVYVAIRSTVTF